MKNKAIEEIVKVIPDGIRDFNFNVFYGGDADILEVLMVAKTLPFLSPRRVVLFRDLEKVKLSAQKSMVLEDYLKDPSLETTLVITTEDTNASRSWSKKFSIFWKEVDFRPLRGKGLHAAVREAARERGCRISAEAVEAMIEAVGQDLGRIQQEMEKLSTALGKSGEIGVEEVHRLVCGYSYQTVFDLVRAVCDRDLATSLRLLSNVGSDPKDTGLIGMLAKRLRILWYLAGSGVEKGTKIPAAYRIQGWQLGELQRQAAGFSRGEIENGLKELLRVDAMIKTSSGPPRLLLEYFLLGFLGK